MAKSKSIPAVPMTTCLGCYIFEVTYCKVSHLWKRKRICEQCFLGNRDVSYEDVSMFFKAVFALCKTKFNGDCLRSIFTISRYSFHVFLKCLPDSFRFHVKLLNSMIPVDIHLFGLRYPVKTYIHLSRCFAETGSPTIFIVLAMSLIQNSVLPCQ